VRPVTRCRQRSNNRGQDFACARVYSVVRETCPCSVPNRRKRRNPFFFFSLALVRVCVPTTTGETADCERKITTTTPSSSLHTNNNNNNNNTYVGACGGGGGDENSPESGSRFPWDARDPVRIYTCVCVCVSVADPFRDPFSRIHVPYGLRRVFL